MKPRHEIIVKSDGSVLLMSLVGNAEVEKEIKKANIDAARHFKVQRNDLPKVMAFFDAWEADGESVKVNMDKARELHLKEIRRVRNDELNRLDKELLRAQETGKEDLVETIKKNKSDLRGLPSNINLEQYLDEQSLFHFWPEILPAREILEEVV